MVKQSEHYDQGESTNGGETIQKIQFETRKHLTLIALGIIVGMLFLLDVVTGWMATVIIGGVLYDLMKFYGTLVYYALQTM